ESAPNSGYFLDDSIVISILKNSTEPTKFSCGFICKEPCTAYHFGIFIVEVYDDDFKFNDFTPQVVWLANRNDPVRLGATLNLTSSGELILQDLDGSTVWTTNTSGKSVAGMNLTDTGNLVLFNVHGSVVWQSFDYPTDCLLSGQKLLPGQKLIANVLSSNWTTQKSSYSFELSYDGFKAYYGANPLPYSYSDPFLDGTISYAEFLNGGLFIFYSGDNTNVSAYTIPLASSTQYIKLMSDGNLKVFEWQEGWKVVADLLINEYGKCDTYPMACGRNSLCTGDGQCSCPAL
ncbi:G-type lectin S-receptor-like serine/threonine-protein kinase SD2-5, partial [Tanacetum coccineum]